MKTKEAVIERLYELCEQQNIKPNALSNRAGVPQATLKSILNPKESLNPGIVTIKKLCDGFEKRVTLADFFNTEAFRNLEQEIE